LLGGLPAGWRTPSSPPSGVNFPFYFCPFVAHHALFFDEIPRLILIFKVPPRPPNHFPTSSGSRQSRFRKPQSVCQTVSLKRRALFYSSVLPFPFFFFEMLCVSNLPPTRLITFLLSNAVFQSPLQVSYRFFPPLPWRSLKFYFVTLSSLRPVHIFLN